MIFVEINKKEGESHLTCPQNDTISDHKNVLAERRYGILASIDIENVVDWVSDSPHPGYRLSELPFTTEMTIFFCIFDWGGNYV